MPETVGQSNQQFLATASNDRPRAPFDRRSAELIANRQLGAYNLLTLADADGPTPKAGQFYMLSAESGWGGAEDGRPFLPRALSFARVSGQPGALQLDFLLEAVGPGTERLCALDDSQRVLLTGPFGNGFAVKDDSAAVLVGGGIGAAPLLALSDELAARGNTGRAQLLGFRSAAHAECVLLFDGDVGIATDDGSAGSHGLVTALLEPLLSDGDLTVFSCGPPAMLEAIRALCAQHEIPSQLALESPMACGFGACFGCVVPTRDGYLRVCVDGPVLAGEQLETAVVAGSGH